MYHISRNRDPDLIVEDSHKYLEKRYDQKFTVQFNRGRKLVFSDDELPTSAYVSLMGCAYDKTEEEIKEIVRNINEYIK